jgi:hypothetical protein
MLIFAVLGAMSPNTNSAVSAGSESKNADGITDVIGAGSEYADTRRAPGAPHSLALPRSGSFI